MSTGASPQFERDNARMLRDLQRDNRQQDAAVDALTRRVAKIEVYIRGELRTWLEGLASAAAFTDPFPDPPF